MNPNFNGVGPRLLRDHRTCRSWRAASSRSGRRWRAAGRDHQRDVRARTSSARRTRSAGHIGWGRDKTADIEIVGVVARRQDGDAAETGQALRLHALRPGARDRHDVLRARPATRRAIGASVRQVVRKVDSALPISEMKTMTRADGRVVVRRADGGGAVGRLRRAWRRCSRRSGSTA